METVKECVARKEQEESANKCVQFRREPDGTYHADIDNSGRFGMVFSSFKEMRAAIRDDCPLVQIPNGPCATHIKFTGEIKILGLNQDTNISAWNKIIKDIKNRYCIEIQENTEIKSTQFRKV